MEVERPRWLLTRVCVFLFLLLIWLKSYMLFFTHSLLLFLVLDLRKKIEDIPKERRHRLLHLVKPMSVSQYLKLENLIMLFRFSFTVSTYFSNIFPYLCLIPFIFFFNLNRHLCFAIVNTQSMKKIKIKNKNDFVFVPLFQWEKILEYLHEFLYS